MLDDHRFFADGLEVGDSLAAYRAGAADQISLEEAAAEMIEAYRWWRLMKARVLR